MRRIGVSLAVVAMLATACTGTGGTTTGGTASAPGPTTDDPGSRPLVTAPPGTAGLTGFAERFDPAEVSFVAALERFDGCESFLDHIRVEALARVGPYGLEGEGGGRFLAGGDSSSFFGTATTVVADAPVAAFDDAGGPAFSGTNVQVAGVDEPDIWKTDGRRIVAVVDGRLHHVDVSAAEARLTDSVRLPEGWDHRLFLHGDKALVVSGGDGGPVPLIEDAGLTSIFPPFNPTLVVTEVDLSDPGELRVGRTLRVQGTFVAARAIGSTVRLVATSYPVALNFVFPSGPNAEEIAAETNRRIVAESTLETWLPTYVLSDGDDVVDSGVLASCDHIHRPAEFAGFEMLSVVDIDLEAGLAPRDTTTLTARGETVYASADSLYVATNVWVPQEQVGGDAFRPMDQNYQTALHKFSIGEPGAARYEASGSVVGHLLNQFSLNEFDGRLQVATTQGAPWSSREQSESFVTVFAQDGDRLEQVGQVGGLGRGEQIFSARFIGDTAYVVTFRQVDPLYVVDLRDPAAPRVAGELKIPGFSSYLHPLEPGRLLGVGQDATGEGRVTGAKVSLFDVSDPADPVELDVWTMPDASSDVAWDHHAFLYWAPEEIAALPVQAWATQFFGAVVLDTAGGLAEVGRISHDRPGGPVFDCEPLTAEKLGVERITTGPEMVAQLCGPEDPGGAGGSYYCEVWPPEELVGALQDMTGGEPVDVAALLADGGRVEICWRQGGAGNPVLRTMVIGDDLWTLSRTAIQANALQGLEATQVVTLP